jgi:hypothetical protein
LASCAKDMNAARVNEVQQNMYALVKSANDYNKKSTASTYTATVREGSCSPKSDHHVVGYSGKQTTVKTTAIIVDTPDTKQSWKITFDWVKNSQKIDTDLGTIMPECLPTDQLPYGDFKCTNILSLAQHGTEH